MKRFTAVRRRAAALPYGTSVPDPTPIEWVDDGLYSHFDLGPRRYRTGPRGTVVVSTLDGTPLVDATDMVVALKYYGWEPA